MSVSNRPVHAVVILTAAICLSSVTSAFCQSTATPPTDDAAKVSPTSTQSEASTTTSAQQRQSKKAARKADRMQKKADLVNLEKKGYNPAGSNNYPDNLQNAEKKANGQ